MRACKSRLDVVVELADVFLIVHSSTAKIIIFYQKTKDKITVTTTNTAIL